MIKAITRCTRCILPSSYPGIQFNEEGVCNYCLTFDNENTVSEKDTKKQLDTIIKSHRGRGKYDVIVGLSGGKDSSYVAYYLKKEYDLRILGVHIDNGHDSEYALHNLQKLVDTLDINLITIRPNQAFVKKLFAHFLKHQGEFCSVCNNFGYLLMASFFWTQKKALGFTPLGVGGWSKKYEYQPGVSVTSMQYFFDNLTPALFDELMTQPFIVEDVVRSYMQMSDPRQAQINTDAHNKLGEHAMNLIQLPDFISWDLKLMPTVLTEAIGWQQPSGRHDSHFDCGLFPIKEYLKIKKFGLSQETIKNSVMIREGQMTREDALSRMALEQTEEPEIMQFFLKKLGLSPDDVNEQGEWSR